MSGNLINFSFVTEAIDMADAKVIQFGWSKDKSNPVVRHTAILFDGDPVFTIDYAAETENGRSSSASFSSGSTASLRAAAKIGLCKWLPESNELMDIIFTTADKTTATELLKILYDVLKTNQYKDGRTLTKYMWCTAIAAIMSKTG